MGKTQSVRPFLARVAEQKQGFSFGEPERIKEDGLAAVVPILRKTSVKRQYVTFPEATKVLVNDTGRISEFLVKNGEEASVFLRAGTIFKGATQERCLVRSAIVFPGKEQSIEVRCVHQSKGIRPGTQTTYGGISPLEVDQGNYQPGYRPKDQSSYWQNVNAYSRAVGGSPPAARQLDEAMPVACWDGLSSSSSSSYSSSGEVEVRTAGGLGQAFRATKHDDLRTTVHEFSANIDDVLRRVERKPNQVGLGIITDKGCQTVELFDLPDSWAALHTDAVRRVGQDLSRKGEDVFQYKPEFALKTISAVLADEYEENLILELKANGDPAVRIIGLTSERFIGEVVELEHRVIHVVLNRRVG